ncbi:MAG: hypothetical protein AAB877_02500 [Patescibacteria group bacterium]
MSNNMNDKWKKVFRIASGQNIEGIEFSTPEEYSEHFRQIRAQNIKKNKAVESSGKNKNPKK